jgi:hypothetical protein
VAAGLVAALLLAGCTVHGKERQAAAPPGTAAAEGGGGGTVDSREPIRVGGRTDCPPGWPVLATSDHRSYPPGHPSTPPPTISPVACYRTAAQAAEAGYRPAPLPPGAMEVAGVYLAPTGPRFWQSCRQAAHLLGFAAPCPALLPSPPPGAPAPRLCAEPGDCLRGQALLFSLEGFQVPVDYRGAPGGQELGGYLSIAANPSGAAAGGLVTGCQDQRRAAATTVHRVRAVLADCPEAGQSTSFGGTVVLRWLERGTVVTVGLVGLGSVNRRLATVIGDHLQLVAPAR